MTTPDYREEGEAKRKRRHHYKSRNGCLECRRRRIKCGEEKPTCTRCVLGLHKCIYALAPQSDSQRPGLRSVSSRVNLKTPDVDYSLSSSTCSISPKELSHTLPETDYDGHDSPALSHDSRGRSPSSDLEKTHQEYSLMTDGYQASLSSISLTAERGSEVVLHSLLAMSAASLAWTLISTNHRPVIRAVQDALMLGYSHYNKASARMRASLSDPDELEDVIASAIILVPFAASSQKINHWLSMTNDNHNSFKFLSSTPRDIIVMLRGIRTMLELAASSRVQITNSRLNREPVSLSSASYTSVVPASPSSRHHALRTMLSATSANAFHKLQSRVDTITEENVESTHQSVQACREAFEALEQIRKTVLYPTYLGSLSAMPQPNNDHTISSTHSIAWLDSFVGNSFARSQSKTASLAPTEPLTRLLLSFYAQVPQRYLDIVLPMLDQRLEKPLSANDGYSTSELNRIQAVALDIYAHWSVLMCLVEEQSWWIGSLPEVTLIGMVNRYGTRFVSDLWPAHDVEGSGWWPGRMLNMLQELKGQQP